MVFSLKTSSFIKIILAFAVINNKLEKYFIKIFKANKQLPGYCPQSFVISFLDFHQIRDRLTTQEEVGGLGKLLNSHI